MSRKWLGVMFVGLIGLALVRNAEATTWADREVSCPVCDTANTFRSVMSCGGYIYYWPTKYEYVFWPYTESECLYSCAKCRLTLFMEDFEDIPPDKVDAIRHLLEGIRFDREYKNYTEIPMSQKLDAAEKLYAVLGKDDEFWCLFYRVKGFHYGETGNETGAREARKKALDLARKMANDGANIESKKELIVISGAMKHLLDDDDGAFADFNEAAHLKYTKKRVFDKEAAKRELIREGEEANETSLSEMAKDFAEENEGSTYERDSYLTELAREYADGIRPREVNCPCCGTSNVFKSILRYGVCRPSLSSRTQYLLWPDIDTRTLYSCKSCRLTLFKEDFENFPRDKQEPLKAALQSVRSENTYDNYVNIPMLNKMDVSEKLYGTLEKDEEFWLRFYTIRAFHLDAAGKADEAREARTKALALAEKALGDSKYDTARKELLVISGASKFLLGKKDDALADFKLALQLKYTKAQEIDEELLKGELVSRGEEPSPQRLKELQGEAGPKMAAEKDEFLSDLASGYIESIVGERP